MSILEHPPPESNPIVECKVLCQLSENSEVRLTPSKLERILPYPQVR